MSEIGKAILTGQIPKHVLELWNHENQQDCHNHDCHDKDCDRIEHGRLDLAFDSHRFFHELSQAIQNHFKNTAQLTRLDHADEEFVEHLGMLRKPFGECTASLDYFRQLSQHTLENLVLFLTCKYGQSGKQGQARRG